MLFAPARSSPGSPPPPALPASLFSHERIAADHAAAEVIIARGLATSERAFQALAHARVALDRRQLARRDPRMPPPRPWPLDPRSPDICVDVDIGALTRPSPPRLQGASPAAERDARDACISASDAPSLPLPDAIVGAREGLASSLLRLSRLAGSAAAVAHGIRGGEVGQVSR